MSLLRKILSSVLLFSIGIFAVSLFFKNKLPDFKLIQSSLEQEPLQQSTSATPIEIVKKETTYQVTPLFSYDIYGLVVADYDSENAFDFAHKNWNDKLNTKDLCVIWGENVQSDIYQKVKFSHGEWTCYVQVDDAETYTRFNEKQLSNNHLLPSSPEIYELIKRTKVGDQIHLRGYLSKYAWSDEQGRSMERGTSTTRDDMGNGACETIYVTDYQILEIGNELWGIANRISLYVGIICLGLIFLSWFKID